MITMILPAMVCMSFLFFTASCYFKDKINPNITSDNIFYTALYITFFNLFIISIPMNINIAWVGFSALNDGGVFNNFLTLFSSFSMLAWLAYSVYIGIFIISYSVKIFEKMKDLKIKRGRR